jgi:hypothetical protein
MLRVIYSSRHSYCDSSGLIEKPGWEEHAKEGDQWEIGLFFQLDIDDRYRD